jgi:hypothetical protein
MDTAKALDSLLNGHTLDERANTLGISRATANKRGINNYSVLNVDLDLS